MSVTTTEQTIAEPVVHTAEILPFRPRAPVQADGLEKPAHAVPPMTLAQQRLARALETLNAALVDQRAVMAAWRASLAELKTSTAGLGDSLERYRTNLAALGQGVSSLRAQAKALRDWAETVEQTPD